MRSLLVAGLILVIAVAGLFFAVRQQNGFSTRTPPGVVERALSRAMRRAAIPGGARELVNPVRFSDQVWADGRAHFADHCASCHANDGSGQTEMGRNLYPRAPDMRLGDTQQLTDGELYWIIENGVRLTGMPAWGAGGSDDRDTWKLVHFIRRLNGLSAEQIREMEEQNPRTPAELKEEQDDQNFLNGDITEVPSPETVHHH